MSSEAHTLVNQVIGGDFSGPLGRLIQKILQFSMVDKIRTSEGAVVIHGLKNWTLRPADEQTLTEYVEYLAGLAVPQLERKFR